MTKRIPPTTAIRRDLRRRGPGDKEFLREMEVRGVLVVDVTPWRPWRKELDETLARRDKGPNMPLD